MTHSRNYLAIYSNKRVIIALVALTTAALFSGATTQYAKAQFDCSGDGYIEGGGGTCTDTGGSRRDPAQVVLTANPNSIRQESATLLSWGSDNSYPYYPYDNCSIDNGIGYVNSSGSMYVYPSNTTTYTIYCSYSGNGISTQSSATVYVTPIKPAPPQNLSYSCNAAGTAVYFNWGGVPGADNYYFRLYDNTVGAYAAIADGYGATNYYLGSLSPNHSYSWWVHSNVGAADYNPNHISDPTYGPSFVCPGQPNLVAYVGPAVSTVAGVPTTFTGTTYNAGNGTTGSNFYDLFVFYYADQATWQGYQFTSVNGWLGAGQSQGRAVTYTFPSPGTYYYRLCTDWNGNVAESNENDNCSGLQSVTVQPPVPGTPTGLTGTCSANGTSANFSWNATPNATSYYPRISVASASECPAGWQIFTDGTTCYPNPDYWANTSVTNFPTVPGRTYSWWVHAGNSTGINWGSPGYGSFTCTGQADLTAGLVSPTTAIANQPVTFSATATNGGTASSGSFPILFQVSQGDVRFNSGYLSPVAPGGSGQGSASYTFSAPGTYQVRACANYNTGWAAITPESNYSNNCGLWTDVTVDYAKPAPPTNLSYSCNTAGNAVTLNWNAGAGAQNYYVRLQNNYNGAYYPIDGVVPTTYTYSITPGQQYVWWVHSNVGAADYNPAHYSDPTTGPTFICQPPPVPTCSLVSSAPLPPTTLTWSSTNATSCTGGGFSTGGATSGSTNVSTLGNYNVSCTGLGGSCSQSVVLACTNPTGTLVPDKTRIQTGGSTNLTYTASGITTSCTVSGPGVNTTIPANICAVPGGSVGTGALTTQSTYTLTCDGVVRATTIVNVVPKFKEF